jgi:cytochrome P450
MHAWVVTSYPEVVTVLMNYSADRAPRAEYLDRLGLSSMKPFAEMMRQQMLFMDDPLHSRLHDLCAAAFTPRKVEELRSAIQCIADELIDKVIASGRLDFDCRSCRSVACDHDSEVDRRSRGRPSAARALG